MLYEELALALSIRRCILVAYLRFQRPHCRQALRVHTVSHDIRLTRDALVAVPENCPDHDVCHPKLMQIGGQSSPERMPTVPTDRLATPSPVGPAWKPCARCFPSSFRISAWRSSCFSNPRSAAPWRVSAARTGSAWPKASALPKRSAKS